MFSVERLQRIKQILYEQKHIDVPTLKDLLNVSEVTVRRDLEKLEKEGFLTKSYGGAVLNQEVEVEENNDELGDRYIKEKKLIGSIAAQLVENDEAIFLGAGNTCMQIAKNLKNKKRLTVVTNDIGIASEINSYGGIKVVICGGEIVESSNVIAGQLADQLLRMVFVNKAFVGVKGVDLEYGYTAHDMSESMVYQRVISVARETIVVADHSKFNKVAFAKISPLDSAKRIVSNKDIDDKYKKYFFSKNIKLYTTYQID